MFSNEKPKSFQGPKGGPGPWPIRAHFVCMTLLYRVGKNWTKKFGAPLNQILDPPLNLGLFLSSSELRQSPWKIQMKGSALKISVALKTHLDKGDGDFSVEHRRPAILLVD